VPAVVTVDGDADFATSILGAGGGGGGAQLLLSASVVSTAPVTIVDGLVLLGGADGVLRALRPDGSEAWRVQLRWPVEIGPLPLADGILAIGGDGDLHRYRR